MPRCRLYTGFDRRPETCSLTDSKTKLVTESSRKEFMFELSMFNPQGALRKSMVEAGSGFMVEGGHSRDRHSNSI
ncbi:hypothetical protein QQ045_015049 [Rhodiola kirilowii]